MIKPPVENVSEINQLLRRYGVKFGIYKNGQFKEQFFPFDPIPRVIDSEKFKVIKKGLVQRADALNKFLFDIYHEKNIIRDGIVPEDFVYISSGYLPQCENITPPENIYSHIYKTFFRNFVFDKENTCSAAYNLERAYDNGIVLREEISTEAFAYLQLAIDTLEGSRNVQQGLRLCLMPLEDILYSFFGCLIDHVFNDEIRDIFLCAKSLERLELYIRLKYKNEMVLNEFGRLCGCLERIPENTPYRYNPQRLEELSDIINSENGYSGNEFKAVAIISRLFEEGGR